MKSARSVRKILTSALIGFSILNVIDICAQINDCADAEVVCSNADLAFNPEGPGLNDFADPDNHSGCIVDLEQNSAWYYFQIDPNAPPDLILGFIIHPKGGLGEDYDWALFGPGVACGDLGFPIRCSSSSAQCGFCPETGMGMGTTDVTEGPGTGDGFVSTLIVQPGQGFYLLIDNWQGTNNGFILEWTDTAADYLNCEAQPPCALGALAGTNINACADDPNISLTGSSTGNHGNETYSWSGTNGGTAYLSDPNIADPAIELPPGFNGMITYTLTVTEDTCTSEDEVELTVHPLPDISINPAGPYCANESSHTLTAAPPGGAWGGAATGNDFHPIIHGPGLHSVTYTYTDGNNCVNTAEMEIEVFDIPDITIDPDPAEFCDNEGSLLLTATGSGAGGFEYAWSTPTGMDAGNTYNATVSGAHIVSVTDAHGCTNTAVVNVVANQNPDVNILNPGPICGTEEFVMINATPSGGEFIGGIISEDGEINPNTIPPGTYSISYTYINPEGCAGTDVTNITITPTPQAFASNNGPLCEGQPIILSGETDGTGTMISYLWTGPNGYTSTLQNPTDATAAGSYSLDVTVDGCASLPAFTNVVLTTSPDAMAQNGGPYCNGEPIQLFGSTSSAGNITYSWTGPNGFSSGQQNPTNANAPGVYTLIVSNGSCSSVAVTTEVIFNTPPDAEASNSGPYCAGETVQLFGSTNSTGINTSYIWTGPNGYTSTDQNPSGFLEGGSYHLIVNIDGCNSADISTDVTVHPLPQPLITGQASFCTGNSATIDAGGGYTSYLWNTDANTQTIVVTSSGSYLVTVYDVNGCSGIASFEVAETPSLSPAIIGDLSFCEGANTMLDAGAGYSDYLWSNGETSQIITVSTEGNIGVLVMDNSGCSGSANVTTSINPNPTVMIGGSTSYCIGGFTTLDAGDGYASYIWSNASTSQTITVSTPGMYTVDVIDMNGCQGSASVSVEESTELHPVITGTTAFCENESTVLNAGSGFATYLWSNGAATQTLSVNTTGVYSVSVSDGQGCNGESSVAVTEVIPPAAELLPGKELCNTVAGGSVINLFDLIISGDKNGTWEDLDQSGAVGLFDNLDFHNIPAGNYRFAYTTNSAVAPCSETTYEILLTILDCSCPDALFIDPPPVCNSSAYLDLSASVITDEPGTWVIGSTPAGNNPATLQGNILNISGSDPGLYGIEYHYNEEPPPGCELVFLIIAQVDSAVNAGTPLQPLAYCYNEDVTVNLSDLITGEDVNGTWKETSTIFSQNAFDANTGTFKTISQLSGIYSFEYSIESNNACPDDATEVEVMIHPLPMVIINPPNMLDCKHPEVELDANGSSSGPDFEIEWNGPGLVSSAHTLQPVIDKPGIYTLTILNTITGCLSTASVDVLQNADTPTGALIVAQDPFCFGDQNGYIQIDDINGGTPPYQFSINDQVFSNNNFFANLEASIYELIVEDAIGCQWQTSITLVEPPEITLTLGDDLEIELGDSAILNAVVNISANQIDTVIWSHADIIECTENLCLRGSLFPANSITVTATVVDKNGCKVSDDVFIFVDKRRKLFIPTAFSPNDDGINDMFYVFGSERQIHRIKSFAIYNRWGDVLFEVNDILPNDISKGWDGTFKNLPLNPGVFTYRVEIEYIDGVIEVVAGDVTLIK